MILIELLVPFILLIDDCLAIESVDEDEELVFSEQSELLVVDTDGDADGNAEDDMCDVYDGIGDAGVDADAEVDGINDLISLSFLLFSSGIMLALSQGCFQ